MSTVDDLRHMLDDVTAERDRLRAENARLVSILGEAVDADVHADDCAFQRDNIVVAHKAGREVAGCDCWRAKARAALARAGEG
jgi:hypothetical protein